MICTLWPDLTHTLFEERKQELFEHDPTGCWAAYNMGEEPMEFAGRTIHPHTGFVDAGNRIPSPPLAPLLREMRDWQSSSTAVPAFDQSHVNATPGLSQPGAHDREFTSPLFKMVVQGNPNQSRMGYLGLMEYVRQQARRGRSHWPWELDCDGYTCKFTSGWGRHTKTPDGYETWSASHGYHRPEFELGLLHPLGAIELYRCWRVVSAGIYRPGQKHWMGQPRGVGWTLALPQAAGDLGMLPDERFGLEKPRQVARRWVDQLLANTEKIDEDWTTPTPRTWWYSDGIMLWGMRRIYESGLLSDTQKDGLEQLADRVIAKGDDYEMPVNDWSHHMALWPVGISCWLPDHPWAVAAREAYRNADGTLRYPEYTELLHR